MSDSGKAVFLSYASQDAEAAKRICEALRQAGVEVWFDAEGGLEHGDEWDAKIRRQIKECVLFLPIISANTQAREEGYFRIEWELAAQRSLGIASGVAFILPVIIDGTREPDALVPDRFRTVQWTRLPGGHVPPEVLQRLLKLWSHRTGALKHTAENRGQGTENRGRTAESGSDHQSPITSNRGQRPPWLLPAIGVAAVAMAGAAAWFALRPSPAPAPALPVPAAPPAATPPVASAPVSEPRQLAARARALFDALDSTDDDYKLAGELLVKAKRMDDSDAEVWATEAQLHSRYLQRGWDVSDARRESMRTASQRALRLDPQSFEARFAAALLPADTGSEGEEKQRRLRELRQEQPANQRLLRALATTLNRLGHLEEADAINDESAALPGGDPLALYNKSLNKWFSGRTVEAEQAIEASLAQRPFTGARLIAAWYAIYLHGDADRARAILAQIPAADMQQDRAAYFAYFVEYHARQPDAAIARLQAVPRDWFNDSWYRGPKALLMGDALQLAGRPDAAAVEWRKALRLVEERLAKGSAEELFTTTRISLLARLGERAEAEKELAIRAQRFGYDLSGAKPVPRPFTYVCILLGKKTEAIQQIAQGLRRDRRAVDYTVALLRANPIYDPLRDEPEFAQVIAQAEAIEAAALPPRDWPKDPELKRAHGIISGMDASMETVSLAEEIVKAALAQRPADPEATTIYAMLNTYLINRGYDYSEERYVLARRYCERALQLAPEEPEAMAAMAQFLTFRNTDYARAGALIRRAMELVPQEPRFARVLVYSVLLDTDLPAALAQAKADCDRFPRDPLTQYDLALVARRVGDLALMEQALDRTIALAPLGSAIVWKGWLAAWVHEDLPQFKVWLERITGNFRLGERAVFMRYVYACLSGDTAYGLESVRAFPGTWMNDFYYVGPRSLLIADLYAAQGKTDLAAAEYEKALAEIRQMAARNPSDDDVRRGELWALHGLGRKEEGRAAAKREFNALPRPFRPMYMVWWQHPLRAQFVAGERADALALVREAAQEEVVRTQMQVALRIDPAMAPFRGDPEIKALLAEPAKKP